MREAVCQPGQFHLTTTETVYMWLMKLRKLEKVENVNPIS